jgi:hypothetical protein
MKLHAIQTDLPASVVHHPVLRAALTPQCEKDQLQVGIRPLDLKAPIPRQAHVSLYFDTLAID